MSVCRHCISVITLFFCHYLSPVLLTLLIPVSAHSIDLLNTDSLSCDLSGNLKGYYLGIHDNPFGKSYDGGLVLLRLILSGSIAQKLWFEFHALEGGSINPIPDLLVPKYRHKQRPIWQ